MQSSVNTGFYTVSHKLFVLRGNYIWPKGEVSTLCVDISKQGAKKELWILARMCCKNLINWFWILCTNEVSSNG